MTRKNFSPAIKAYLLEVLESEDHGLDNPSELELIKYCKDRFYAEYSHEIPRKGVQSAIKEWLLGLALGVDYTYYNIEKRLISWGVLEVFSYTENKLEKELELYWGRLASILRQLFDKVEP